ELLPLVAGMLLVLVVLAWGMSAYLNDEPRTVGTAGGTSQQAAGSEAAGSEAAGEEGGEAPRVDLPVWMLLAIGASSLLVIAAGGYLIFVVLRTRQEREQERLAAGGAAGSDAVRATHRVRVAYARYLEGLAAAGLGRGEAETPLELAGRAGDALPALAGPANTLTRLYEPVRYGALADEAGADAAEAALAACLTALAERGNNTEEE
ncbi:MAG TPA: DUF4129 domain-containing protein, partial [Deinococcales bacterium]|nr:DUF4129 domain-containing protein [Deinococcales bacterium]